MATGASRAMSTFAMQQPPFTDPGHTSSGSSASSGRERRRLGKLKQQRKLDAARARIHELEAQIGMLHGVIAELTMRTQCGPSSHSPAHDLASGTSSSPGGEAVASPAHYIGNATTFDLYASEVSDASVQTDICVDHRHVDVFVSAQQLAEVGLPQSLTPCEALACSSEVEHAADTDAVNANVDGSGTAVPTCLCAADAAAGGLGKGFNSQTLANTVELFADSGGEAVASPASGQGVAISGGSTTALACEAHPGAEAVASAAPGSLGVGSPRTTPSTPGSSSPGSSNSAVCSFSAINDKNTSCAGDCDDNSGNMPCGRSATAQTQCGQFATVAVFGTQEQQKDYNSQHLALSDSEKTGGASSGHQCGPSSLHGSADFNSQTLANQGSLVVLPVNAHVAVGMPDSAFLAQQCGPLPHQGGVNFYSQTPAISKDFSSQLADPGAEAVASAAPALCAKPVLEDHSADSVPMLDINPQQCEVSGDGVEELHGQSSLELDGSTTAQGGTEALLPSTAYPVGSDEAIRACQRELQSNVSRLFAMMGQPF